MENSYIKVDTLDYESIEYIYAKPLREHYYMYGINSIDNLSVISKDDLIEIMMKLKINNFKEFQYIFDRNLAFLYEKETAEIRKFKAISNPLTKEDVTNKLFGEMKQTVVNPLPTVFDVYSNLFDIKYIK